ncbi:hypothetical protein F7725_007364 [Dissostichus mawsoni]|uniref:DUF4371 domain-containing protein n=1 Tax=Dissostichus mawsoni TaxID=36200 RepID=A0A7J5XWM0_DISMA|nr:hypothetical protein F7725_007364 [Dissostichus mawsoni]
MCFFCAQAFGHGRSNLAKNADRTFCNTGFRNWKKATKNVQNMSKAMHTKLLSLPTANKLNQSMSSFLQPKLHSNRNQDARQGAALRGHAAEEGNLSQLLKVRSEDDPGLERCLSTRKHDFTSPQIQNEMLNLFANTLIREIISAIYKLPLLQYSIIIDGTQDIEGTTQEAICVRYVDHDLVPQEAFLGSGTVSNLWPLCQTRWTTRTPAIWSVLRQCESVLLSLEDMAQTDASNTGVTARGLLERFGKGTVPVLGLMLATEVIQELECLNCTLQKQTETVSGMLSAADSVRTKRKEEKFQEIYSQATEKIRMLILSP